MRKEKREKVKKSKDEGVNRQRMSKNGKGYPGPMGVRCQPNESDSTGRTPLTTPISPATWLMSASA